MVSFLLWVLTCKLNTKDVKKVGNRVLLILCSGFFILLAGCEPEPTSPSSDTEPQTREERSEEMIREFREEYEDLDDFIKRNP